jgi:hypothetical protein
MNPGSQARSAARTAANSKALTILARTGFAASGLVHLLLGYLSIRVALDLGGESDQSGALSKISRLPGGSIILWLTVVGLAALGLWLLIQAALGIGSSSKKRWARSVVTAGKAVAYLALGGTALTFAQGHSASSSDSTSNASRSILALPGGQILLALVGLGVIGIGGYFIYKGVTRKFATDIVVPSGPSEQPVIALGITGYVAKGIAVVAVGILFVVAAIKVDAQDATGLDGALKSLADLPYGEAILIVVGVGLIAYGIYTFARARLARL